MPVSLPTFAGFVRRLPSESDHQRHRFDANALRRVCQRNLFHPKARYRIRVCSSLSQRRSSHCEWLITQSVCNSSAAINVPTLRLLLPAARKMLSPCNRTQTFELATTGAPQRSHCSLLSARITKIPRRLPNGSHRHFARTTVRLRCAIMRMRGLNYQFTSTKLWRWWTATLWQASCVARQIRHRMTRAASN